MIAYFDTSAVIPLLIEEPGSQRASRLWDAAERVVSVRLIYAEARAALAQAVRVGRIEGHEVPGLVVELDDLYRQLDRADVDDALVQRAGDLAQEHALRGYDAVHLAAAERLAGPEVVLVAGDGAFRAAAAAIGLAVGDTST